MGKLQTIAKDTAIYGLSSIIGRFLNYLLVPLYTAQLSAASGGYGVITNMYAYVALILVILTFGMETTYFRFTNKTHTDSQVVYSTTLISVGTVAALFALLVIIFITPISQLMGYGEHPEWVWVMALTVAIDSFLCIPFAHLRQQKKAIKFAALKLLNIVVTVRTWATPSISTSSARECWPYASLRSIRASAGRWTPSCCAPCSAIRGPSSCWASQAS